MCTPRSYIVGRYMDICHDHIKATNHESKSWKLQNSYFVWLWDISDMRDLRFQLDNLNYWNAWCIWVPVPSAPTSLRRSAPRTWLRRRSHPLSCLYFSKLKGIVDDVFDVLLQWPTSHSFFSLFLVWGQLPIHPPRQRQVIFSLLIYIFLIKQLWC